MFGKRLRATRLKRGYTQQKMSDMLGIALRSYQKYEQGERQPSLETLVLISDILNTSIDYLLGRDDYLKSLGVPSDEFL